MLASVNWWAVLASMAVVMALGSMWYSEMLFGPIWQKELKMTQKQMGGKDPTTAIVAAALLTLVQATVLAVLIGSGDVMDGLYKAGLVSIGLGATAVGVQYAFEARSVRLLAVNAGYIVVTMLSMGALLGAWH